MYVKLLLFVKLVDIFYKQIAFFQLLREGLNHFKCFLFLLVL